MATVTAFLPAPDAETVFRALDATARAAIAAACAGAGGVPAPRLPIDHARADALVGWAENALADPDLPRAHGRRVDVRVTMTLPALLGLTDDPAHLDGYGPISASIARELLPGATLRRVITDPVTGHLLDYGRETYRCPQRLADFVVARDGTCLMSGCSRPAVLCDLDHHTPFDDGGCTNPHNIGALCERHHRMKHETGWRLFTLPSGEHVFISATGRQFRVRRPSVDPSFPGPFATGVPPWEQLADDSPAIQRLKEEVGIAPLAKNPRTRKSSAAAMEILDDEPPF
jgi:hypothetical protein